MNTLVVFYSRTGTTRTAAEMISRNLGADLEEIWDPSPRKGVRGYLRSLLDATLHRAVPIESLRRDLTRYDLVVVGTPVWGGNIAGPVRAFLETNGRQLRRVAFFVTEGGRGDKRVLKKMGELAGAPPLATLALVQRDVDGGRVAKAIDAFARILEDPRKVSTAAPQPSMAS
jgi:flavodoxin